MSAIPTVCLVLLAAALSFAGVRRSGSCLYPPALLCGVWALAGAGLLMAGDMFYPLSYLTVFVYTLMLLAFTMGGHLVPVIRCQAPPVARATPPLVKTLIDCSLVGLAAGFVPYVWYLQGVSSEFGSSLFWFGVRQRTLVLSESLGGGPFSLAANAAAVATIICFVAANEAVTSKAMLRRFVLAFLLALAYSIPTAARTVTALVIVGSTAIYALRRGAVRMRNLIAVALLFVCLFGYTQMALFKVVDDSSSESSVKASRMTASIVLYCLGGLVAFDQALQNPDVVQRKGNPLRFFIYTANKFGAQWEQPPLHADPIMVSPSVYSNVYTFCSFYYSYGIGVVALVAFALGYVCSLAYRGARRGNGAHTMALGGITYCIVMTVYTDCFSNDLNSWLKFGLAAGILYSNMFFRAPRIRSLHAWAYQQHDACEDPQRRTERGYANLK